MRQNKKHIFVSGTDTEIGKTYISTLIALYLEQKSKNYCIVKPLASGCQLSSKTDVELIKYSLQKIFGTKEYPIFPLYEFKLPAAPNTAAKDENRKISISKILKFYEKLSSQYEIIISEGIGGIAVPINNQLLLGELIKKLTNDLLLVSNPKLGTINHTILSTEYANNLGLNILGIVISYSKNFKSSKSMKTLPGEFKIHTETSFIEEFAHIPISKRTWINTLSKKAEKLCLKLGL